MRSVDHTPGMSWIRKFPNDKSGATAIIMAFLIPLFLAGLAFGAEFAYFELAKRRLQNAADTSAYAAGTQKRSGLGQTELETAALAVAIEGGYNTATGTLTVSDPPVAPSAYAGNTDTVNVALTQTYDRMFSQMFFSTNTLTLDANSTVLVTNGRPACILSLNPSMSDAVTIAGSSTVVMNGCDVAANSIASDAVSSGGNAAILETDCVSSVGGVDDPAGIFVFNDCGAAIENAPVTADPYADVPEPTWASCDTAVSFRQTGSPSTPPPGCYQGVGTLNRDVQLSAGVYILKDSDLQMTSDHTISGTDVTIFLTGASGITIVGNSTIDIKAPTSGDYAGVAIFTDRDDPIDLDLSGNTGVSVVGAIYAPNFGSDVTYIGNNSSFATGECTQIIAGGQIEFTGNSDFSADCSATGGNAIMAAETIQIVE